MLMKNNIIDLIKEYSGQVNLLTIPRILIDYCESIEVALFLSQILYWNDKSKNNGWIYKSYKDWEKEIALNEYRIRKITTKLKKINLIETKIKKVQGNPTCHYRLKNDVFSVSFLEFLKKRNFKFSSNESLNFEETINTEITSKITTDINGKRKKFIKPTPSEVNEYLKEINCTFFTGEYFCDFYESKGWFVGKNKMKEWKATVRNWERREFEKKKDNLPPSIRFKEQYENE